MDSSPPASSVLGILQARILSGLSFLPQGIFPTLERNPRSLAPPEMAGGFFAIAPRVALVKPEAFFGRWNLRWAGQIGFG